jgi:hypothetical protein
LKSEILWTSGRVTSDSTIGHLNSLVNLYVFLGGQSLYISHKAIFIDEENEAKALADSQTGSISPFSPTGPAGEFFRAHRNALVSKLAEQIIAGRDGTCLRDFALAPTF